MLVSTSCVSHYRQPRQLTEATDDLMQNFCRLHENTYTQASIYLVHDEVVSRIKALRPFICLPLGILSCLTAKEERKDTPMSTKFDSRRIGGEVRIPRHNRIHTFI